MIKIVVADDHKILRQGLKSLLQGEADFSIIGEAEDGIEATRVVEELDPDVLVVDLLMAGRNGLEVTRELRKNTVRTRIVFLSMYGNEAYVSAALEAGAQGYVLKEASATELVRAIREAHAGRSYLSPPLSEEAIEKYRQTVKASTIPVPDSPRPRQAR